MTLLARVGGQLYAAARDLERAEGVARLVREHGHLMADMPTSVPLTWEPLLEMGGDPAAFRELFPRPDEAFVVRFLVGSEDNPRSVAGSIERAREHLRSCREVLPSEAWVVVNDLHLHVSARRDEGADRRSRVRLMDRVIEDHQRFLGILLGGMTRDAAFTLMRLGRHLERAALAARVLEVRADPLLGPRDEDPYADVQWIGVLRSLSALHMFHRASGEPVSAVSAMRFLLLDATFPRSVAYCLTSMLQTVGQLPTAERVVPACSAALELLGEVGGETTAEGLHGGTRALGRAIDDVAGCIRDAYFPEPAPMD